VVTLPMAGSGTVKLYSLDGKEVVEQAFQTRAERSLLSFDVNHLPSGNYNLVLEAVSDAGGKKFNQAMKITVMK